MSRIVGVDPGTKRSGLCLYDAGRREAIRLLTVTSDGDIRAMEQKILDAVDDLDERDRFDMNLDRVEHIALETFTFRSPRVTRGLVKNAAEMGMLIGLLERSLGYAGFHVHLVNPSESKANQPDGAAAKKLGIPGKNPHERSAWMAATWLAQTMRLASGGRRG